MGRDNATVCVIDDDPLVREVVAGILSADGFAVVQAKDGDAGMEAMARHSPALIVTDIMMPNRDGLETIREAKRRFPTTPILVMSGSVSEAQIDFLALARKLGADAHIKKPFERSAFLEQVRTLLPG
jgi:DNA-binding response OmpR family regulator